jgi:hypothetical protein
MMNDLEREQLGKTYDLCRFGFFILTLTLVPACIFQIVVMFGWLADPGFLRDLVNSPVNRWISTLCVWGCLAGTMMFWGRWNHPSWQRRTGFLLFMFLVDVVLWFTQLGEGGGPSPYGWMRSNLGRALGWAEFALLASLAGDFLVHLGIEQAEDSAKSTRSLIGTGALIWIIQFCEATFWDGSWPLRPRQLNVQGAILLISTELIFTIAFVQVMTLVIAAFRQANRVLQEMKQEDDNPEPLRFVSDAGFSDFFKG